MERNGIHIIDLKKTHELLQDAQNSISKIVGEGKTIMFVGTKKQAKEKPDEIGNSIDQKIKDLIEQKVELDKSSIDRINICRAMLEKKIESKEIMYGVNTGIGEFSEIVLTDEQIKDFQKYLIFLIIFLQFHWCAQIVYCNHQ